MNSKKKNILKHIARCIGFWGIFVAMLSGFSHLLTPANAKEYDTVAVAKFKKQYKTEPKNTIDMIIAGDSESYATFSPLLMYQETGFTSYVCGTSAQRLCDTYSILETAFETQSPKVVVLETNNFFRTSESNDASSDGYESFFQKIFPVFKHHSRWKTYFIGNLSRKNNFTEQQKQKGFRFRPAIKPYLGGNYMIPTTNVKELGSGAELYINKIIELCRNNGAQVLFVSAPSPICMSYSKHNAIQQLADKLGVDYLDLNITTVDDLDWTKDTKDAGNHLNYTGAKKVSVYISKYFDEKYDLPDHRNDEAYRSWDENLEKLLNKATKKTGV